MKKWLCYICSVLLVCGLCSCGSSTPSSSNDSNETDSSENLLGDPYEILDLTYDSQIEVGGKQLRKYKIKVKNILDESVEGYLYYNILDKDGTILTEGFVNPPELEPDQAVLETLSITESGFSIDDVYEIQFTKFQRLVDTKLGFSEKLNNKVKLILPTAN